MKNLSSDVETSAVALDVERIRQDFPALQQHVYGKPLVYLDNAATTQKPGAVINALRDFYVTSNSNVHRGIHLLSERATRAFENARITVQHFLNASDPSEIIFVRGTTEAINLVAQSYGRSFLKTGDEIIISWIEHHSNIVPWQLLCEQIGAKLKIIPVNQKGELILEEYEKLLSPRTKLVSIGHVSNALGTINPIRQMIQLAHHHGAVVMIDGAQAVQHLTVDVQDLDCDFYAFSGHKIYGPTGIGILYGKSSLLEKMPPYQGGGEMISSVTFERTLYSKLPHKFEAGTPNIAGTAGLDAALQYVQNIGYQNIVDHENELLRYATDAVSEISGLRIIGTAEKKASVLSFVLDQVHPHDVGTILDREGIAVRAGHHCAMPVMNLFGVPATVRASFGFYNTKNEVDVLVSAIRKVKEVFGV
jgi:cysteine desulfurase / selenocysteine lyase